MQILSIKKNKIQSAIIGIDIGGTNIKVGLVNDKNNIIYKHYSKTSIIKDSFSFINTIFLNIKNIIDIYSDSYKIIGIGLGVPGIISKSEGMIIESPNLLFLKKYPLIKELSKKIKKDLDISLPILLDNDANTACLGYFRGTKKISSLVMITLGTGLGGAAVLNSELFTGDDGNCLEVGHTPIFHPQLLEKGFYKDLRCGCGGSLCLELIASIQGLKNIYHFLNHKNDKIAYSKEIYELAKKDNKIALEAFKIVGESIGYLFAYLIQILNIQNFFITGGLSNAKLFLINPIKDIVKKNSMNFYNQDFDVKFIESSNELGILGAAALLMQHNKNDKK